MLCMLIWLCKQVTIAHFTLNIAGAGLQSDSLDNSSLFYQTILFKVNVIGSRIGLQKKR